MSLVSLVLLPPPLVLVYIIHRQVSFDDLILKQVKIIFTTKTDSVNVQHSENS